MFCYFLGFLVLFPFIKITTYLGCVQKLLSFLQCFSNPFFLQGSHVKMAAFCSKRLLCFELGDLRVHAVAAVVLLSALSHVTRVSSSSSLTSSHLCPFGVFWY